MSKAKMGLPVVLCLIFAVGCAKESGSISAVPKTLSDVVVTTS